MAEIGVAIATGVRAYLSRQVRSIFLLVPLLAALFGFRLGWAVALAFVLGVATSLATALMGMNAAVHANVKTAQDASDSPLRAFCTAVSGGSVMGFSVPGFSLAALTVLHLFLRQAEPLIGFGSGASLAALFAQIGGGIFKSAYIGADLVGKIEKNIVSLIYAPMYGPLVIFFPFLMQALPTVAALVGVSSIRAFRHRAPESAFDMGILVSTVVAAGSFLIARFLLNDLSIWLGVLLGILVTLVATVATRYYAGTNGRPARELADAAKRDVALNIITGLSYGLQSPPASIAMIVVAVSLAYHFSSNNLLAVVAVNIGSDLLIGYIMTADAYGPITDTASGIAEMSLFDSGR